MIDNVLDASAIPTVLQNEKGQENVTPILGTSVVSRINVTEVLTKLVEKGMSLDEASEVFDSLDLLIAEFDKKQSLKVAELRPLTKHLGLSLGDRCCLALAIIKKLPAITADKNWATLNFCQIKVIR